MQIRHVACRALGISNKRNTPLHHSRLDESIPQATDGHTHRSIDRSRRSQTTDDKKNISIGGSRHTQATDGHARLGIRRLRRAQTTNGRRGRQYRQIEACRNRRRCSDRQRRQPGECPAPSAPIRMLASRHPIATSSAPGPSRHAQARHGLGVHILLVADDTGLAPTVNRIAIHNHPDHMIHAGQLEHRVL